jgi:predicted dehydrogenase
MSQTVIPDNPFELRTVAGRKLLFYQGQEAFLAGIYAPTDKLDGNFDAMMRVLSERRNNFFRHWTTNYYLFNPAVTPSTPTGEPPRKRYSPFKWAALSKWELSDYNLDYFTRLRSMIAAAARAGRLLTVSHQGRANPATPFLRDLIQGETLGRLVRVVWLSGGTRTQYYFDTETWRGTWAEEGGGTLINQKVHDLDRFSYLVGQPREVAAFTTNLFHRVEPRIDTLAGATMMWDGGAVGVFQASITDGGADLSRLEFHGDRACLVNEGRTWRLGYFSMPASEFVARGIGGGPQHKPPPNDPRMDLEIETSWEDVALPAGAGGYPAVFGALARAAGGQGAVAVTPEEGRNAVELVNAITLSSLRRRSVRLPLDRDEVDAMLAELRAQRAA